MKVTFYTKEECTLCDLALEMIMDLRDDPSFELDIVDITESPDAWAAYWDKVPVIKAWEQILRARIDESELRGFMIGKM